MIIARNCTKMHLLTRSIAGSVAGKIRVLRLSVLHSFGFACVLRHKRASNVHRALFDALQCRVTEL